MNVRRRFRFVLILSAATLLSLAWVTTSIGENDPTLDPARLHAPSAQPDRIILTWAGDPSSTQAVTWRTEANQRPAVAELAVSEDGPAFKPKARQIRAATELFTSNLGTAAYHSIRFENLISDTRYVYRVGDGYNWSEWAQFRTAAAGPAPLEFVYVGDAQNNIFEMWSRLIRSSYAEAPRMRFIIHAGDLINTADRDEQWGEWHSAAGWINQMVCSIPVPGNHEYGRNAEGVSRLNANWRPQFTLPENSLPGLEETSYYIDIQGVRIAALNSNVRLADQAAWLDQLLENNPNTWTIVTFHHPVFSTARGRDNLELRKHFQPVFDKHGVDMVLTGHDHSYGRSNLVSGLNRREGGTVYVVSVSGPKMYPVTPREWMARKAEDTQLFQVIRVDGNKLRYESRTARGDLYDAFELLKRGPGRNEMINRVPYEAEFLRPTE